RGPHARAHAAAGGVEHAAIRLGDRGQMIGAALRGQQPEEIARELGQLHARADLIGELLANGGADPRPGQHVGRVAGGRDELGGALELGLDLVGLVALARQLEDGLGVGLRDGGRCLHEVFIPAMASATIRRWSSSRRLLCTSFSATATARSPTSRRSSSRARRTSASSCAFVSSTILRAWAWAAATCLRDSSAASFSACSRTAAASA